MIHISSYKRFVFHSFLKKIEFKHGDISTGQQNAVNMEYCLTVGLVLYTYVSKNVPGIRKWPLFSFIKGKKASAGPFFYGSVEIELLNETHAYFSQNQRAGEVRFFAP